MAEEEGGVSLPPAHVWPHGDASTLRRVCVCVSLKLIERRDATDVTRPLHSLPHFSRSFLIRPLLPRIIILLCHPVCVCVWGVWVWVWVVKWRRHGRLLLRPENAAGSADAAVACLGLGLQRRQRPSNPRGPRRHYQGPFIFHWVSVHISPQFLPFLPFIDFFIDNFSIFSIFFFHFSILNFEF